MRFSGGKTSTVRAWSMPGLFRASCHHACHYLSRRIAVSVHGDEFTAMGPKNELDWFEPRLKASYELTVGGSLGPGPMMTQRPPSSTK